MFILSEKISNNLSLVNYCYFDDSYNIVINSNTLVSDVIFSEAYLKFSYDESKIIYLGLDYVYYFDSFFTKVFRYKINDIPLNFFISSDNSILILFFKSNENIIINIIDDLGILIDTIELKNVTFFDYSQKTNLLVFVNNDESKSDIFFYDIIKKKYINTGINTDNLTFLKFSFDGDHVLYLEQFKNNFNILNINTYEKKHLTNTACNSSRYLYTYNIPYSNLFISFDVFDIIIYNILTLEIIVVGNVDLEKTYSSAILIEKNIIGFSYSLKEGKFIDLFNLETNNFFKTVQLKNNQKLIGSYNLENNNLYFLK